MTGTLKKKQKKQHVNQCGRLNKSELPSEVTLIEHEVRCQQNANSPSMLKCDVRDFCGAG